VEYRQPGTRRGFRLGLSDEILPRYGAAGFYTSTLFQYQQGLLEQVGPALEMGRSFIRAEYQKSFSPLLLLWKGIGTFIARNPKYQVLFGPVSINNQYQSISRQLIMRFLEVNNSLPNLAHLIKPKNPPFVLPPKTMDLKECSMVVRDIEEVSDLISEIEAEQKDIPILLKQYLKLGAKILGFNIDPDFGDVLDGLILVDLHHTDYRLLERFAGPDGAKIILAYQNENPHPHA
jgi:putative hemolysin